MTTRGTGAERCRQGLRDSSEAGAGHFRWFQGAGESKFTNGEFDMLSCAFHMVSDS